MTRGPCERIDRRRVLACAAGLLAALSAGPGAATDFAAFLDGVAEEAIAAGVSRATAVAALRGLDPDPRAIAASRRQSEFTRPFHAYVDAAVSAARLRAGRAAVAGAERDLAFVEREFGVDRAVVSGIWGMESNFGRDMGDRDVIRSLASLASVGHRGGAARAELIAALVILDQGHVGRDGLVGSWAGAMGQTQFIPTSFLKYAVDADGDGRKDIWSSRRDALASAAEHLKRDGWRSGLPWGFEVVLPDGFDFALADRMDRHDFAALARAGVTAPGGGRLPRGGAGGLFIPAGLPGPVFVVTDNFEVIRQYNTSDAYAVGVGHLGDRLFGGPGIAAPWPRDRAELDTEGLAELQRLLKARGFPMERIDGKLGWRTRRAVQAVQREWNETPDGHPTPAFLARLRGG